MGWQDYHLHEFRIRKPNGELVRVGIPDQDFPEERPTLAGWMIHLADYLGGERVVWRYLYDFGDSWEHKVTFQGSSPRVDGTFIPAASMGLARARPRACPPEDVGVPRAMPTSCMLSSTPMTNGTTTCSGGPAAPSIRRLLRRIEFDSTIPASAGGWRFDARSFWSE